MAPDKPWPRGYATVNVNPWLNYFNVRSNAIDMVSGTSYIIKIKPIDFTSEEEIRDLPFETRKCQFKDEKELI